MSPRHVLVWRHSEDALTNRAQPVKNDRRATSRGRRAAFLERVTDWVAICQDYGIDLVHTKGHADYYPELPGGKMGRALEVYPISRKTLVRWRTNMASTAALPVMRDDVWLVSRAFATASASARGVRLVAGTGCGLRDDGTVIDGLHASGTCPASLMGRTYSGPGATLGPAVVSGLIAARTIAHDERATRVSAGSR